MFRQSTRKLGEGGWKIYRPVEKKLPADTIRGTQGPLKIFRPFNLRWIMDRLVQFGREGDIVAPILFGEIWLFYWYFPQKAMWGDKKPPRVVDWNTGSAGYLAKN